MGSKRERRSGVWELRVHLGRNRDGKPVYLSRTFHGTGRAADKALAALETDVDRKGIGAHRSTMTHLIRDWLELQSDAGIAPTTMRTYRGFVKGWILPAVGERRFDELTPGDVRALFAKMTAAGLSASAVHQVRAILSGALGYAVEREWIGRNVARLVKAPPLRARPPKSPAPAEATALLEAARRRDDQLTLATAIALGLLTGARLGELCALRWSDIDLEFVSIARSAYRLPGQPPAEKDTKTHAERSIALDPVAVAVLEARRQAQRDFADVVGVELVADPFILSKLSDGSGPVSPHGYTSAFGRLRDKLGLSHVHFHSLRHYSATQMIGAGVDIRTTAGRLGHGSPSVTLNTYAHMLPERDRQAAELLGRTLEPAKKNV